MKGARNRQVLTIVISVLIGAVIGFLAAGLIFPEGGMGRWLQGAGVAGGAEPTYGSATVDGNPGEWNLTADFFADMYRAGDPSKKVESKLYLRYDCGTGVMYALVLSAGNWPILVQGNDEVWIKLNGGKVGFASFAWVGQGYDGDGAHAQGWEASFPLGQGGYSLAAHNNVFDDGGSQTAGTQEIGLTIDCYEPTAVFINYFTAQIPLATTQGVTVVVRWETAAEIDNAGFNLYRGTSANGPWTKLNSTVIPGKVPPGSVVGATYEWVDNAAPSTSVYYLLEDIDLNGSTTQHGPVQATGGSLFGGGTRP